MFSNLYELYRVVDSVEVAWLGSDDDEEGENYILEFLHVIKTFAFKGVNGTVIDKSWGADLSTQQSTLILRHFASFWGRLAGWSILERSFIP